ncbi:hypothetical protein ANO11243_091930 [Dothideomycetidae sp. 11243]|nr:hypothetical protein ANO11243_091930 [fungal sp. No.11243]
MLNGRVSATVSSMNSVLAESLGRDACDHKGTRVPHSLSCWKLDSAGEVYQCEDYSHRYQNLRRLVEGEEQSYPLESSNHKTHQETEDVPETESGRLKRSKQANLATVRRRRAGSFGGEPVNGSRIQTAIQTVFA